MNKAAKALDDAKEQVRKLRKSHPDLSAALQGLADLLDIVGGGIRPEEPVQRRTGQNTRYAVEGVGPKQVLGEYRAKGQPLRIGRDLLDAVVTVLSESRNPLFFDDIVDGVHTTISVRPAEWQVRVAVRFLLSADPPIIRRRRSRYEPVDPKNLRTAMNRLWIASVPKAR